MHKCFTGVESLNNKSVDKWKTTKKMMLNHNGMWITKADITSFLRINHKSIHRLWITLTTVCDPVDNPVTMIRVHYIKRGTYPQFLCMKQI